MLLENLQSSDDDKQTDSTGWMLQLRVVALAVAAGLTAYVASSSIQELYHHTTHNWTQEQIRKTHSIHEIHGKTDHDARAVISGGDSGTWDPATMTITLDRHHGK